MSGRYEVTCRSAILRNVHRQPQQETVGYSTEDEGPSVIRFQGAPRESGKGIRAVLKAVRADNGGEYRGQFEEYCRC